MNAPDRWFIVILTFAKRFCIIKCTPDNCCNLQPNILLLFIHTKNGRKKNSCCLMLSSWNSGIVDWCYAIEQVLLYLFPIFSGLLSSLWMRQASHSKVALFVSQLLNLLNKAKLEASWSLQIEFKWWRHCFVRINDFFLLVLFHQFCQLYVNALTSCQLSSWPFEF